MRRAFADAKLRFAARHRRAAWRASRTTAAPIAPVPLPHRAPADAGALFEALAEQFNIVNSATPNTNDDLDALSADQAARRETRSRSSVKKYLPLSYREAFNLHRAAHAQRGDRRQLPLRHARRENRYPGFMQQPRDDQLGQGVRLLPAPAAAGRRLGMIYPPRSTVEPPSSRGGWLYVDLADGSDYAAQQTADATFIRRYAARIPRAGTGSRASSSPPCCFPCSRRRPTPTRAPGNYDQLFIEAAEYDDGFAKIVHGSAAGQPATCCRRDADGCQPVNDVGIRLGWDDEQILIWYIRQLARQTPRRRVAASASMRRSACSATRSTCASTASRSLAPGVAEPGPQHGAAGGRQSRHGSTIALGDFDASCRTRSIRCSSTAISDQLLAADVFRPLERASPWCCPTRTPRDLPARGSRADRTRSTSRGPPAEQAQHDLRASRPIATALRYGKRTSSAFASAT